MRGLLRAAALSVIGFVASYAMKKMMNSLQKQAEAAQQQASGARRDPRQAQELKTLRQDPATGVYYAED
jgi:type II secretory pathway pseudopilin PulG